MWSRAAGRCSFRQVQARKQLIESGVRPERIEKRLHFQLRHLRGALLQTFGQHCEGSIAVSEACVLDGDGVGILVAPPGIGKQFPQAGKCFLSPSGNGVEIEPLTNQQVIELINSKMPTHLIVKTIESARSIKFDTSPAALIALKRAGAEDSLIEVVLDVARARGGGAKVSPTLTAPEQSEVLRNSKDPEFILRNFRTMYVVASAAQFFNAAQMKAELGKNKDFPALGVSIVEERALADTILEVSYTFAWDYPFVLKHQNTSVVLLSGKGEGAFSGPAGAASVADRLIKRLKPYRVPSPKAK